MWIMEHANHAKVAHKECVGQSTFLASKTKIPWEREEDGNKYLDYTVAIIIMEIDNLP